MAEFSTHAWRRAVQRHLSEEAIQYIIANGVLERKAGARIFYLRACDIPEKDQAIDRWSKLVGSAVLLSSDGQVIITVWRNRRTGLRRIKRKPDHNHPLLGDRCAEA